MRFLAAIAFAGLVFNDAQAERLSETVNEPELRSSLTVGVTAQRLGVIVNDADPYSVAVGDYYTLRRKIPAENVVHIRMAPGRDTLTRAEFELLRKSVTAGTPSRVQAFALTWVRPYRVDCMSITSAFALGFDSQYCASGCSRTRESAYFNARTRIPADAFGLFPAMSLAAGSVAEAKALIDRGIAADASNPKASAYLVSTGDSARNVRASDYASARRFDTASMDIQLVSQEAMHGRNDVMFYFVGATAVPDIRTHRYLPGAVADHLTSYGGELLGSRQMSSLEWIRAGATGTYGTVVEPCAFTEKFPNPTVLLRFYLAGETLIEAYWKSVRMPGQGIFVGEPLSRPFALTSVGLSATKQGLE